MIQAFFFDMQTAGGDRGRPEGIEPFAAKKVVVLGAGMMGAAIAYVSRAARASRSCSKDVRGRQSAARPTAGCREGPRAGRSTQERAERCSRGSRRRSTRREPRRLRPRHRGGVRGPGGQGPGHSPRSSRCSRPTAARRRTPRRCRSPTSRRPSSRPDDFIGLHFFSPVDKMPLLEIIEGEQTSEETLDRALDYAKQISKTPIVVNDSRGFFTSRVIGTFINEGVAMLPEGVPAPSIEQASSQAGYPAPVLQLTDELNLTLVRKIRDATKRRRGGGRRVRDRSSREGRRPDARERPRRPPRGRRLLRVRRGQAGRPVAGAEGAVPADGRPRSRSR